MSKTNISNQLSDPEPPPPSNNIQRRNIGISIFSILQPHPFISQLQNGKYPKQTIPIDSVTLRPINNEIQYPNICISICQQIVPVVQKVHNYRATT